MMITVRPGPQSLLRLSVFLGTRTMLMESQFLFNGFQLE